MLSNHHLDRPLTRFILPLTALLGISAFAANPPAKPPVAPSNARGAVSSASAKNMAETVPVTGKLSEHELTLLAISCRPELDKLRGAVDVAIAQRKAAGDLVNPELRFGYAQDNDGRFLIGINPGATTQPRSNNQDTNRGALVRFYLPHPWELKARIQRAAAEISLAEAEYYAGEDLTVRTVRNSFQELAILQSKLVILQKRKTGFESYRNWLDEQKTLQLGLDLAAARAKVYSTLSDIHKIESDIATTREQLAAYCGLPDANRIELAIIKRRISNPRSLDIAYLTDIAMLYRSDVLSNQARLAIAQAQLSEAKAANIPFTTFIDIGYNQRNSARHTGQSEEWYARLGVTIPLWDWTGFNKKNKVFEVASKSLEQQIATQHNFISIEIAQAVKRLIAADQQLANTDKDLADLKSDLKKALEETHMATADVNDLVKGKRIESEFQDLALQMEISRYSAFSAYYEVVITLEKALGIRLERALSSGNLTEKIK